MTFSDYMNIILKMMASGSENHEIFEKLESLGLDEGEIGELYDAVINMLSSGYDSAEVLIDDPYDRTRRVFVEEELRALKSVPGLLKAYAWGDMSIGEFERALSDLSSTAS